MKGSRSAIPNRCRRLRPLACLRICAALGLSVLGSVAGYAELAPPPVAGEAAALSSPNDMLRALANASARGSPWTGPRTGPPARRGAKVAIVSEDLGNGGILGVAKGVKEAAGIIGWHIRIHDAGGTEEGRRKALSAALASNPDGLIIVGADAGSLRPRLDAFAKRGIPMVGWHVGPVAGAVRGGPVAMNVSTDPLQVARIAAMAAVAQSGGRAGVVIFTDGNFEIAMAKARAMAEVVRACKRCTLLAVRDVAISRAADSMGAVTQELLMRHGLRWTHALAINDIYFDYAVPEFIKAGRSSSSMSLISAGDGSAAAFLRIRAGAFQTATVAEPLNLQGWQLVDELNRLLVGEPVTGHVIPVHLVTRGNIVFDGGPQMLYDPDNGYREIYRRIWKP